MFSLENPAESITELIDFLRLQHNRNYAYRGQVADYDIMLPSIYRNMELNKAEEFYIFPEYYKSKRIEIIKMSVTESLMRKFGTLTGNYLAQQYLAKSGCIDITDDLDVAAFFATMRYPKYNDVIVDNEKKGVIFRINKNNFKSNLKPEGVKKNPYDTHPDEYLKSIFIDNDKVESFVTSDYTLHLADYSKDSHYIIHENITTHSDIKNYLYEIEDNSNVASNINQNELFQHFKRAHMQSGGMIQPKYLCKYPKDMAINTNYADVIGIEDIYSKYSIEKFYFNHSKVQLKYSKEDLWPSIDQDHTLAVLCFIILSAKRDGKIEDDIHIDDIIDFGYEGNLSLRYLSL